MAETQTPNYQWVKPDIGGDASNWGNVLNTLVDNVDSVVYANQQAGVPIGSITMFGGAAAPANWLLCQGQSLSTTGTYAALFALLGYAHGGSGANFNLPDLRDTFPIGASATRALAAKGGVATVTLDATMIPTHTHTATQAAHTHTATQAAHTHGDQGHTHPDAGSSQDAHNHTFQSALGSGSGLTNGGASFSLGQITTSTAQPAVHVAIGTGYANLVAQTPAITVTPQTPAITVAANTGGGAAHNNMPPWLGINFIIRFQ